MSGPSRAEIEELKLQYRGMLGRMYPGYAPEQVCVYYAALEQQLKGSGAPDLKLKNMGRVLKSWMDRSRGHQLKEQHCYLVAAYSLLEQGMDAAQAGKRARTVVAVAVTDPAHVLHTWLPKFRDGVLVTKNA